MLEIKELKKSFEGAGWRAKAVSVLNGVSMMAPDQSVTGILGANGAGKTTLFKICAGLLKPDSGVALVNGVNPATHPEDARRQISLLPEYPDLPAEWKGREVLMAAGALRGLEKAEVSRRVDEAIEWFNLASFVDRESRGYSRGQAMRIALGRELITKAPCLILDEPTVGLDFESAAGVRRWVRARAQEGCCVLVATHIVSEIEAMCDQMVGLRDGMAHDHAAARQWIDNARDGVGVPLQQDAP